MQRQSWAGAFLDFSVVTYLLGIGDRKVELTSDRACFVCKRLNNWQDRLITIERVLLKVFQMLQCDQKKYFVDDSEVDSCRVRSRMTLDELTPRTRIVI